MRITIKLENFGSTHTTEHVVSDKTTFLEFLALEWDHAVQLDSIGKYLVLTGLRLPRDQANVIGYIKAVRNGSNLGLKEAKEAVEAAILNRGILKISREYNAGIVRECEKADLSAHVLDSDELVCHEVMES